MAPRLDLMHKVRSLLAVLLLFAVVVSTPLTAAEKPINSICPVTGKPVDTSVEPVIITIGKGERSQRIVIGVSDAASAEAVKNNPSTYIGAAKANRKASP